MKSLAKGTSPEAILKLIRVLLDTQQSDFFAAVAGDTSALCDIADELQVESPTNKEKKEKLEKSNLNEEDYELWQKA